MQELISLREASKLCQYSQEYLSLRARQGKLKALKTGRNWSTTREWLQEYLTQVQRYAERYKEVEPPSNLPIDSSDADTWEEPTREEIAQRESFLEKLKFAFATFLVVAFLGIGVMQGKKEMGRVSETVTPVVVSFASKIEKNEFSANIAEIAREYIGWVGANIKKFTNLFRSDSQLSSTPPQKLPGSLSLPQQSPQGLVVLPSSSQDEEITTQIKRSFSDEVKIRSIDRESGIITPVFRHRIGKDYLYILVPLQKQE